MIKRFLIPVVIVAVAVVLFIMLKQSKPHAAKVAKPEKVWLVNATPAVFQTVAPEVTLYGRVETPRDATLKSALEADVVEVMVLEGTEVQAGQPLIQLDATDVRLLIQQRQADVDDIAAQIDSENARYQRDQGLLEQQQQLLTLADKAVVRAQKLEQSKLASQSTLDDALAAKQRQLVTLKQLQHDLREHPARLAQLQANKKHAQALLDQALVDLQRTTIKAPFSGRISQLNVATGDRVRNGDSLLSLYDLEHLEVRAQIPGRYMSQIRQMLTQDIPLTATAQIDKQTISFNLLRLSGEVRADSGGVDGLFAMQQRPDAVPLGTFVELHLKLAEQAHVIDIPFSALYGLNKIYRVNNGLLQSLTVQRVGEFRDKQGNKRLLIRSEQLAAGDQIISTQLPNAIDGLRVKVIQ